MKKSLLKKLNQWRGRYARIVQIDKAHAKHNHVDDHDTAEKKVDESMKKLKNET